jgi:hypothetical protein
MTTGDPLNPDQLARATAALDAWYDPGPGGYRVPGLTWDQSELESMHAALEAPTADAALEAFGVSPGTWLSTPEQDIQNRALMGELRQRVGREPSTEAEILERDPADAWHVQGRTVDRTHLVVDDGVDRGQICAGPVRTEPGPEPEPEAEATL